MRLRTSVVLALVALGIAAGAARADGDPASDVLYTADTYLPYDAPPASAITALKTAVAAAYAKHFRVKVAVIGSQVDLGSVPSLWGKPTQYAKFLGTELETFYVGPLLIVMPAGFGIYDGGRSVAAETKILGGTKLKAGDSEGLTRAAADVVARMLRAGALRSKDIRAPFAYAFPTTVHRGQRATFKFGVSDDSAWSKTTARITKGGRTIATLRSKLVRVSPSKPTALDWKVPKSLPGKGVRVCVSAADAAGNRSPKSCGAVVVR